MRFNPSELVVLDSSVVIKWFQTHEILHEQAVKLRQAHLDNIITIHVPGLLIYEVSNVLLHKPDMNQFKIWQVIESLFNMEILIEKVEPKWINTSIRMAYFYDITIYDATFLALAEFLQADFITADLKLIQKVSKLDYVYNLSNIIF